MPVQSESLHRAITFWKVVYCSQMNSLNRACKELVTTPAWGAADLCLPIWAQHMGTLEFNVRVVHKISNIDSNFINVKNYLWHLAVYLSLLLWDRGVLTTFVEKLTSYKQIKTTCFYHKKILLSGIRQLRSVLSIRHFWPLDQEGCKKLFYKAYFFI